MIIIRKIENFFYDVSPWPLLIKVQSFNKIINQKKYFDLNDTGVEPYYTLDFNSKISKIIIKTTTYYFTMRLVSNFLNNSEIIYNLEFKKHHIFFYVSEDIYIDFEFKKYMTTYMLPKSYFITEKFKYYFINTNNKLLKSILINSLNFNIQNDGKIEVFIYRSIYIYGYTFDFIIVTKDIVIFLKSNSTFLYVYENNINFDLYKFEFKSGFELFLRNNNFFDIQ